MIRREHNQREVVKVDVGTVVMVTVHHGVPFL